MIDTPRPGPHLFGPRRPLGARRPEWRPTPLRPRPFETELATRFGIEPSTVRASCRGGGRYVKAAYTSQAAALAQTVVAAAKGFAQGVDRRFAVYACTEPGAAHWHMTGWGERETTNVRLHTPAPSRAHPRPDLTAEN